MNAVGEKLNGQGNGACPKMPTSRTDKDHAMLNIKTDDLNMESFMANLAWDAAKFDPGKREHFIHVMRTLVDCYQSDAKHGIVLLRDGASESETITLMAINADPSQVDDLIDTLCNLRGMSTAASAGRAVN